MSIFVEQFTPAGALSGNGYVSMTVLQNNALQLELFFYESLNNANGTPPQPDIDSVTFQVAPGGGSPLSTEGGGSKVYQTITGGQFFRSSGDFTVESSGSAVDPFEYSVTFTTNPLGAANQGEYYRAVIVSSTGEIVYTDFYYAQDGVNGQGDTVIAPVGPGASTPEDDAYYQSLDPGFPDGKLNEQDLDNSNVYQVENIGPRELSVILDPEIFIADLNYQPTYVVSTGATLTLFAAASYLNVDITNPANLSTLDVIWQKSFDFNPGAGTGTWTDIVDGDNILNEALYTETQATFIFDGGTGSYAQGSTLEISGIGDGLSGAYIRPFFTSSLPNVTDLTTTSTIFILVDPEITITRQPGEAATDTGDTAFCLAYDNPQNGAFPGVSSGDIRSSIAAVTDASTGVINYDWQVRFYNEGFSLNESIPVTSSDEQQDGWASVDIVETNGLFIIEESDGPDLVLRNTLYHDRIQIRCVLSGTGGEQDVISDIHEIYMRDNDPFSAELVAQTRGNFSDVQAAGKIFFTNNEDTFIELSEDRYGDVSNRDLLTDFPTRFVTLNHQLDTLLYWGLDGNITTQFQKSIDGGTNWFDVGDPTFIPYERTQFGTAQTVQEDIIAVSTGGQIDFDNITNIGYDTRPLRISEDYLLNPQVDQGALYRLEVTSSAVYIFNPLGDRNDPSTMKTLVPFYNTVPTELSLYRQLFITGQPNALNIFAPATASFEVTVVATSNAANVNYQWQYSLTIPGTNQPDGNYLNIIDGNNVIGAPTENVYSGAQTPTLVITNTTVNVDRYAFFRCVVDYDPTDVPGALASVTSDAATIGIIEDIFDQITTIDNQYVDEFGTVEWEITATSLSLDTVTFQWQRSYNYGQNPLTATWTDLTNGPQINGATITGADTDNIVLGGVREAVDAAYYRCQVTSTGGVVAFSNVALLGIAIVEFNILQDLPDDIFVLEDATVIPPFEIDAVSSVGETVSTLIQYRKQGEPTFQAFALGVGGIPATSNPFEPEPFSKNSNWDDAEIRFQLSQPGLTQFGNTANLIVTRQFYYFADSATRSIEQNQAFSLDLQPSQTGLDDPTFAWEYSVDGGSNWNSTTVLGAVSDAPTFFLADVGADGGPLDGALFRCRVDLNLVDEFVYSRNNILQTDSVSGFGYTVPVELQIVAEAIVPVYYSDEIGKTGSAIGTVICVPKPPDFVNTNESQQGDDLTQWKVGRNGALSNTSNTSSTLGPSSSAANYIQNTNFLSKNFPAAIADGTVDWVDTSLYESPKWLLENNRFPGWVELRGQWLDKADFPLLFEIIGDRYGETSTQFRLPNPYGKKMMGTGAVDSRTGRTSVIPLYGADGVSGGDRNVPGTTGGVYVYERSRQLPPGSPNISGQDDGTAGTLDPATFTLGTYRTDGWTEAEALCDTNFVGNFTMRVGPLTASGTATTPPHIHSGVAVGVATYPANSACTRSGDISPRFDSTEGDSGQVLEGPTYAVGDAGRPHSHALGEGESSSGNNTGTGDFGNHGDLYGDSDQQPVYTKNINLNFTAGGTAPTLNVFLETTTVTLSNASRNKFDNALQFYVRNAEQIPINSNYFRLKWMIKAY